MRKYFSILCLVALVWIGFSTPSQAEELVILHANDTHSNLFPFGPHNQYGGIARMSTMIKDLRAANLNTLALHAGDAFVGPQGLACAVYALGVDVVVGFSLIVPGDDGTARPIGRYSWRVIMGIARCAYGYSRIRPQGRAGGVHTLHICIVIMCPADYRSALRITDHPVVLLIVSQGYGRVVFGRDQNAVISPQGVPGCIHTLGIDPVTGPLVLP